MNRAIALTAEDAPLPAITDPGPHQRYRLPSLQMVEMPRGALAPGDLRLEVERVGICGSDLGLLQTDPSSGYLRSSVPLSIPAGGRVIGHEGVGVVREVGEAVQGFAPGDWVSLESILTCGGCRCCRRGAFNQCVAARLLGFQHNGLFAHHCDIPATLAHPIGDLARREEDRRAAACAEPAACALVALQNGAVTAGDRVLVLGAGPIGTMAALLARSVLGCRSLVVVEPLPRRAQRAAAIADAVWTPAELLENRRRGTVDLVVDTSGAMDTVAAAIASLGAGGRAVLLARGVEPLHYAAVDHLITDNIAIIGSRGHLGGAFQTVLDLHRSGRIRLDELVTGVDTGIDCLRRHLLEGAAVVENHCKLQVVL